MSVGLLFSGQGTQHPQMLPWLDDEHPLMERTKSALDVRDWRRALQDGAWSRRNKNAQVLLTGVALTAWAQVSASLPTPAAIAGYSVGELAAFGAAGVFDAAVAIDLAVQRAEAMDRVASEAPGGGLGAVTGLSEAALEMLCRETGVTVAIRISADTSVVGGAREAMSRAQQRAIALGGKWSPLAVEVASHTPAMQLAAEDFAKVLGGMVLAQPHTHLISNAGAEHVRTAAEAACVLSKQVSSTVDWSGCLEAIHHRRVSCVLEVGPGSALATTWNRRYPDVPARSVDEFRHARAITDWVMRSTMPR